MGLARRGIAAGRVTGAGLVALTDLALPATCGGCGRLGSPWCTECAREFGRATAGPTLVAVRAGGCPRLVAAASYDGVVRRAVVAFKDGGRRDLVSVLAEGLRAALVPAVAALGPSSDGDPVIVVPAPSSPASRRARGDVPVHLLGRRAVAGLEVLTGRPCLWAPVLRHTRRVGDQARLSREERAANVGQGFGVRRAAADVLTGASVIVVDDIVTTGATLAECARGLGALGADVGGAAVLAATPSLRARHDDNR